VSALVLLVLASAELTPPPASVEHAPEPAAAAAELAPVPEAAPDEWNPGAQLSVSGVQALNGAFLGLAACGASSCYGSSAVLPVVFMVAGGGAGLAFSLMDRELSSGWGRALLVDSITVGAALGFSLLATRPELALTQGPGYALIFATDLAAVAGAAVLTRFVAPRAESVLLADSLGLWGLLMGDAAATLLGRDHVLCIGAGALVGAASGALLAASAQRMTVWRLLIANGAALVGALLLGGGLAIYESVAAPAASRPYNPVVPAAGTAAGIAGGFLIGFALSESL
jgi:hypothetical protein